MSPEARIDGDAAALDHAVVPADAVLTTDHLDVWYGSFRAVRDVTMYVKSSGITALIGPSGCGKSTVLRCFNRMNDLIPGARVDGRVAYHGIDLYGPEA
ncbi:MAG: ATP-binding cassette domain-containing protein, partial [Actinomycetota bacterium]